MSDRSDGNVIGFPQPSRRPASHREAQLERSAAETESVRTRNENDRMRLVAELAERAALRRERVEGMRSERRTGRIERLTFTGVTVLGAVVTAALSLRGAGQSQLLHYLAPGAGIFISGAGVVGLRTNPLRARPPSQENAAASEEADPSAAARGQTGHDAGR